jgi:CheY-like chemotaxis protein
MDPGALATVLHVEDDPNDVLLLSLALAKAQVLVQLQHVADGQQAVNYLSGSVRYADRLRFPYPGLVLLDLKMPNLDGFGVLAWARAQPGMKGLLIMVLSSSNRPEDVSRATSLGADRYLVKTCGYAEVIDVVHEFLQQRS